MITKLQGVQVATEPASNDNVTSMEDLTAKADDILQSGKTFDELLKVPGKGPIDDVTLPIRSRHMTEFDLRNISTTKSQSSKAVHITQFLPEKVKKR